VEFHTIHERSHVKFLQEGGFGVSDQFSFLANINFFENFNLSFVNLGGDLKGVEESDLRGVHSGGSRGNNDIAGSNGSDFGNSGDSVGFDDGEQFENSRFRENKSEFSGN